MSALTRLQGIFTPNVVPLNKHGEIDESELRRYIDWLIEHGVHGLYPNGSTGEFIRFTSEERKRIVQIVCDQARGRVPVLAGVAEANIKETLGACDVYKSYGARAVAVFSPYYYRLSAGAVYAYFREIAHNTPIDVTLYNIPMYANPIDIATVQKLAECPRIIGIKDSSGDISAMLRMMAAVESTRPDFAFLCGWEPALVPMLAMGCHGGTLALSGVVPEITRRIYSMTEAGQWRDARLIQMELTKLFDRVIYGVNFPEGVKVGVEARGFALGPSRQPIDEEHSLDKSKLAYDICQLLSVFNTASN
jgi:4-hydroxy-tetrahydrodipicolinate synthase